MAAAQRDALGDSRRTQIIEAAVRLWLRAGFETTTMDAIAREADLAKGTLYLYFPSKDALLDEAIRRYSLLPTLGEVAHALDGVPWEEAVPRIVRELWRRLREQAPLAGLLMRELPLRPDMARIFLEKVVLPTNRLFADTLDRGVQAGSLRPLDTFVAARALVGMLVVFLLTQEIFGGRELVAISDESIVDTVSDLFLHGALRAVGGA